MFWRVVTSPPLPIPSQQRGWGEYFTRSYSAHYLLKSIIFYHDFKFIFVKTLNDLQVSKSISCQTCLWKTAKQVRPSVAFCLFVYLSFCLSASLSLYLSQSYGHLVNINRVKNYLNFRPEARIEPRSRAAHHSQVHWLFIYRYSPWDSVQLYNTHHKG